MGLQEIAIARQSAIALPALYGSWTGDWSGPAKQAEQLAWRVENAIAAAGAPVGARWGCEWDLAAQSEVGLGVAREALAIMEIRGSCFTRKGPGGGVFVACPSTKMAAQAIANYLLRVGVTERHCDDARRVVLAAPAERRTEAPLGLLCECLTQLDSRLRQPGQDDAAIAAGWSGGDGGPGVHWGDYTGRHLSVAQQVGWAIAASLAALPPGETRRLGSEEDLCCRYGVSRSSMRQAVRLLETFGIVESRPGRGQGLFSSIPTPLPLIRRMSSYFLAMRVSGSECAASTVLFAGAVLQRLAACAEFDASSRIIGDLAAILQSDRTERASVARRALCSAMEQSPNPILNLFWRSMAGYTFRAFPAAEACAHAIGERVDRVMCDTLESVTAGDGEGAARSFHCLLPDGVGDRWALLPQ